MASFPVVVITGGSAGIGRATAMAFAKQGAHVGLLARGEERLHAAQQEVEAAGGKALVLPADVASAEQVESAAARVEAEFGPIDIWVNNASTTVFSPFSALSADEFKRVTEVAYLGVVYGTMAALKRMRVRDRGTIVQVGSALAYRSIPLQSAYCGAKHASKGFTDSLRSELRHDRSHVHLTMVHLPAINTPQFSWCRARFPNHPQPLPPIYQPEVAAKAIVWAALNRRRELYVGGPTATAILWNKFFPAFLDWALAKTAYEGQQTNTPVTADRPDNLFEPARGDHYGAYGIFDIVAREESTHLWATTHLPWPGMVDFIAGVIGGAQELVKTLLPHRNSQGS